MTNREPFLQRPFAGLRRAIAITAASLTLAACGGGGGGGGGGIDATITNIRTFLIADGDPIVSPRTMHEIELELTGIEDASRTIDESDLEILQNGELDTEGVQRVGPDSATKINVILVLDVSSSLGAAGLEDVKTAALAFADELNSIVASLRIVKFATPANTEVVGNYEAVDDGDGTFSWLPPTLDEDIEDIDEGGNATALFLGMREATAAGVEGRTIIALFSDGRENSSPETARGDVEEFLRDNTDVSVFSVGFGDVDTDDLRSLSTPNGGKFLGVQPSLNRVLDTVAAAILNILTITYDTPSAFGDQELDITLDTGRKRIRLDSEFTAGIDLLNASIGRFPSAPRSIVTLTDYRDDPPSTLVYEVDEEFEALTVFEEQLLVFPVIAGSGCTSSACGAIDGFQGPLGTGSVDLNGDAWVPPSIEEAEEGRMWNAAASPDIDTGTDPILYTFERMDNPLFLTGTPDRRRIDSARVAFEGGTRWFAPGIGLIRETNADGDLVLDLALAPCVSPGFGLACVVE